MTTDTGGMGVGIYFAGTAGIYGVSSLLLDAMNIVDVGGPYGFPIAVVLGGASAYAGYTLLQNYYLGIKAHPRYQYFLYPGLAAGLVHQIGTLALGDSWFALLGAALAAGLATVLSISYTSISNVDPFFK